MENSDALLSTPSAVIDDGTDAVALRIIEAARDEFEAVGIRRSNVIDIARRARVSRATLYRRFKDREALVEAVAEKLVRGALARIDDEVAQIEDAEEAMVWVGVAWLRELREGRILNRLLDTEPEELYHYAAGNSGAVLAICRRFIFERLRPLLPAHLLCDDELVQAAELMARWSISMILTPRGVMPFDDDERVAAFLRRYFVPLLDGQHFTPAGS